MFNTGDKVRVYLPKGELTLSQTMRQFHGRISRISGSHFYPKSGGKRTYSLTDCASEFGIPYEFFGDWLIPLEE